MSRRPPAPIAHPATSSRRQVHERSRREMSRTGIPDHRDNRQPSQAAHVRSRQQWEQTRLDRRRMQGHGAHEPEVRAVQEPLAAPGESASGWGVTSPIRAGPRPGAYRTLRYGRNPSVTVSSSSALRPPISTLASSTHAASGEVNHAPSSGSVSSGGTELDGEQAAREPPRIRCGQRVEDERGPIRGGHMGRVPERFLAV